jgi:DNA-binding NarL/FixJ family response regulator
VLTSAEFHSMVLDDSIAPIKVLVVDDHPLFLEGLVAVISGQSDMILVGEAGSGHEAVELFRKLRPHVTLMDLQMPDLDGVDAIAAIRADFPAARIVVLTTYKGDARVTAALKSGACGYLLKNMVRKELLDTIRDVHAGKRRIPSEVAMELAEHASDEVLSSRELEVLRQIAAGHPNKRIADRLNITEETVKSHVKSILSKLSANDRTHAVVVALRRGFIVG